MTTLQTEERRRQNGSGAVAERVAEAVEHTQERSGCIERLNERYAVVLLGAKTAILTERAGEPAVFMRVEDFRLWYKNDRVETGQATASIADLWLAHPQRRQYTSVVFDPRDTDPAHYNLWQGFAVKPDASKSCKKFLAHIKDNICASNEDHYRYLIGWLAHMVQKPEEKPGVAIVLRGEEGVGKGFLAKQLSRLCPHHSVTVSHSEHLTGRFNAHFQQCLLMFVDEAGWAGDKQGEGALKHLVTDEDLLIEQKHTNAFMIRNLTRLIKASNETWTVPAGTKARRWFVLDVGNAHANDGAYFDAAEAEMNNGGLAALMHLLMNFNLNGFNVRTAPKTQALLEQKEYSMQPHERWWIETLKEGEICGDGWIARDDGQADFMVDAVDALSWPAEIKKDRLWESYRYWTNNHNIRTRLWPNKTCTDG
jgi:hypothetical protein